MTNWINNIDEKKVFTDLFNIYEQELLNIFQYIAPINNICNKEKCNCWCKINLNVSWNKIHELHLRVCAECENLMKKISNKLYPERDFDNEYKKRKLKSIQSIIDNLSIKDTKKIERMVYKFADMPFYLSILNKKIWICNKMIEFSGIMETSPEKQISYLQPFDKNNEKKQLPIRWDHYNVIKHYKIENYSICTLWDLINSLWAYYMLLNYFVLNINLPIYSNDEIKSKIFKPTIWWVDYPRELSLNYWYYREDDPNIFKSIYIWKKKIISWYYDKQTMEIIQESIDKSHKKLVLKELLTDIHPDLKNNNYFFYNSLNQQEVIVVSWYLFNWKMSQSWWKLKMEKRFNLIK